MTEVPSLSEFEHKVGMNFFDHQLKAFAGAHDLGPSGRLCLYFPTGKGKSITSLVCVAQMGYMRAQVIAPPATHDGWLATARRLGMEIDLMSHAKFRMKGTKLHKDWPIIADEFHLFGGPPAEQGKRDPIRIGLCHQMIRQDDAGGALIRIEGER